jgi:ribonuclease-3
LEALFGAIFLDAGFDAAKEVIRKLYAPVLASVDPTTLGKDAKTLLQEFLQSKKIALPQYNVVATHGAAHSQEFEIECLVPKLEIQVFGTGGSRRAGEQAAAKLALETALVLLSKTPSGRKTKPRASQMKLAGIATVQTVLANDDENSGKELKEIPKAEKVATKHAEQLMLEVLDVPQTPEKA